MRAIQPLSADIVNRMTAGEAIASPAAAVRELAENAIDAGATRLAIAVWPEQRRIRVADNGSGMSLDDLRHCARPHTTSKIDTWEDLGRVGSLGFRGEALHSLVQLARVEICSRQDAEGWQVTYDRDGNPVAVETAAIAPGSIVTVSDLFGNYPARRRSLPPLPQQLKAIQSAIQHLALCHPRVTWRVQNSDRPWFGLSPGTSAAQVLPQILRQIQPSDLRLLQQEVAIAEGETARVELVAGLPDRCHRRRSDWVKIALNGRHVRLPELEQTVLAAFARTLPRDRYPVCWLHWHLDPARIDWNLHPAKAEIYLRDLSLWQERTATAVRDLLRLETEQLPDTANNARVAGLLKAAESKGTYRTTRHADTPDPHCTELRAIAQVRNTYILAEHPSGLWLIEQHIAHERILFEQIRDRWQLVPADPPVLLSDLAAAQREQLIRIGIEVEEFGDRTWAARAVPDLLSDREDRAEALLELSLGGDLETAQVAIACRSAIRNGTPLQLSTMQDIIDRWQRTRQPRTCPHGRPIYLSLEESSLARFFRRHWVIGKSHGI